MAKEKVKYALADSFCRPDWRWEMAHRLAQKDLMRRPKLLLLDPAVQSLVAYLRYKETPRGKPPDSNYKALKRPLKRASALRELNNPRTWEVEARILAKQSDIEIGTHCGLNPAVIACYASLFFDVRPHLGEMDYLMTHVIGPRQFTGFGRHDVKQFWALQALVGGLIVLDRLVDAFRQSLRPDDFPRLDVYFRPEVPVELQEVVANAVLPSDAWDWRLEFGIRRREAEATADPVRRERILERIRCDCIRVAKTVLTGTRLNMLPNPKKSWIDPNRTKYPFGKQTLEQCSEWAERSVVDVAGTVPLAKPKRRRQKRGTMAPEIGCP